MVLFALGLHGDDLGQEKETLVDVLAFFLALAGGAHASLIIRVGAVGRAIWAWITNSRADRNGSLTRRIVDVCSLGAG